VTDAFGPRRLYLYGRIVYRDAFKRAQSLAFEEAVFWDGDEAKGAPIHQRAT
jgi:hypothetical protein